MANEISEVTRLCLLLNSDKAKERKDSCSSVQRYLNHTHVRQAIDENSDHKRKNSLTWELVFQRAKEYVIIEMEHLDELSSKKSAAEITDSTKTSRNNKIVTVVSFINFIIKATDSRGPRLKISDVTAHVLFVLNSELSKYIGKAYCQILLNLLKSAQNIPKYKQEIPQKHWEEMLDILITFAADPPSWLPKDSSHVTSIIQLVISCAQCQVLQCPKLFKFFSEVFKDAREGLNISNTENLLGALYRFTLCVSEDCRSQVCELGEVTFPYLLRLWRKPGSIPYKDNIVQFLQLQMSIHHPLGAHQDEDGAWCTDSNHWKKCLHKLYEAIVHHITQQGTRIRGSGSKMDPALKTSFLDLAADVFHQVFWMYSFGQALDIRNVDQIPGSSAKRRRVDIGLHILRENLENSTEGPAMIYWLQVLAALFLKHPSSLPGMECFPMLSALHQLQVNCKRQETGPHILRCLHSFAVCFSRLRETLSKDVLQTIGDLWRKVWTSVLKSISIKHHREDGFVLLTTLIMEKLVEPDVDVWKVLLSSSPSRGSLEFLSVYLQLCPIPENCQPARSLLLASSSERGSFPFRRHLLDWLLPLSEGGEAGKSMPFLVTSKSSTRFFSTRIIAEIISSLCLRVPSSALFTAKETKRSGAPYSGYLFQKELYDLETLFIESSFDEDKVNDHYLEQEPQHHLSHAHQETSCNTIPKLNNIILNRLALLSDSVMEVFDFESQSIGSSSKDHFDVLSRRLLCYARYCTLVWHVVARLLQSNVIGPHESRNIDAVKKTGMFLKKLDNSISERFLSSEMEFTSKAEVLTSILQELQELLTVTQANPDTMGPVLKKLMPSNLLEDLLKVYHGRWGQSLLGSTRVDVTDTSFLNQTSAAVSSDEDGFDDFDMEVSSSDMDSTAVVTAVSPQATNSTARSAYGSLRKVVAVFLSTWSSLEADNVFSTIRQSMMDLLQSEDFNVKQDTDLQMYFTVSSCLAEDTSRLEEADLDIIMNSFRQVMAIHRKDQSVCHQALQLLQVLAPKIQDCNGEARRIAAHMIRAFWTLRESYSPLVRSVLTSCMEAYLKVDPEGVWTSLEQSKNNKNESPSFSLRQEFPRLLLDDSHAVRMCTAHALGSLFMTTSSTNQKTPSSKPMQHTTFEQVAKVLAQLLILPERPSDVCREDESVNRSVSMLAALKHICIASPVCEKKAVALVFQALKENLLDQDCVIKVLGQLSKKLGFKSSSSYMKFHLPFVIDNWFNHGFKITEFPHRILGFKTLEEFLKCHYDVILPQIISRPGQLESSMERFTGAVSPVGGSTKDLILQSFCSIVSCLLPWFAVQSRKDDGSSQENSQTQRQLLKERETRRTEANKSYEYLKQTLTPQVVDKTMASSFDEVVLHLLLRMHEPSDEGSDLAAFSREEDPEPNLPYFTSQAIKASLDWLTKCFNGDNLVSVLCKNKDNIQKILLALNQRIFDTHLVYEKRRLLMMYRLFVLLVLRELSGGLGNTWAFFIRDVIYSLRRIISAAEENSLDVRRQCTGLVMDTDLFTPCCNLLYHVCQAAVECCSEELDNHLHVIVSLLVPYAKREDNMAKEALGLLSFLIIESNHVLTDSIAQLDPFPDLPQFQDISDAHIALMEGKRTSLAQEISRFVSINTPPLSRLEGLKHLKKRLVNDKHQLYRLLEENKDVTSLSGNPVADLVHELLHLSSSLDSVLTSTAQDVKAEIANCLAEIGAVDLSTVALTGRRRQDPVVPSQDLFKDDHINGRNSMIVGLLNKYVTDKSVEVVSASSTCLKQVLSTKSGVSLMKKYEDLKADQLLWYLEPFRPSRKKKSQGSTPIPIPDKDFKTTIGNQNLWIPGTTNQNASHTSWITRLTRGLIESGAVQDDVLLLLSPVCEVKVGFAEHIFPYLVHNILESGDDVHREVLSEQIRGFFVYCNGGNEITSRPSSPISAIDQGSAREVNKQSIRTMLSVVNYLRIQPRTTRGRGTASSTSWENNFWLELDYLEVAQAAHKCSAHFTALLYTEIWSDIQKSQSETPISITLPTHSQDVQMEEHSHSTDSGAGTNFQSLLLDIYSNIGEPDSVYGAGAGRLADIESRIRTYKHEEAWDKALGAYDLQVQESSTAHTGLLQALKNFGLYHVMQQYLKGLDGEAFQSSNEIAELQYEAAWRSCLWDVVPDSSSECSAVPGFHHSVHTGLCALQDGEMSLLNATLTNAKLRLVSEVSHVSLESVRSLYPFLVRLQQLTELQEFSSSFMRAIDSETDLLDEWNERFPLPDTDFEFLEPVLALRTSMLQTLAGTKKAQDINGVAPVYKGLVGHLEVQARIAREANVPQVAEKALFTIRQFNNDIIEVQARENVNLGVTWSWRVEEARLRWARDERETATHLLKMLTKQLDKVQDNYIEAAALYPQALGLYGSWLAETRSENPSKIIENYLEKAANLLEDMEDKSKGSQLEAFLSLARYADSQYQNTVNYMKSSEFENRQESLRKAKAECEHLQKLNTTEGDRYIRRLEVESRIDEEELRLMNENKMTFLCKALENYIKTLQAGDKYDLRVFRLCSLWFDNANEDFVNNVIQESLARIQTRKFLPLMYQLAARLGTKSYKNDDFQKTLNELIERVSVDHPHHTMFILMALANADRDREYVTAGKKTGKDSRLSRNASKKTKGFVDEARLQAATSLIQNISVQRGELVNMTKNVCNAYIELAYLDVNHLKKETGPFNLPNHLLIKKLSNLNHVSVPTLDVRVDPLCKYDDIVYIARVSPTFCLAGGINLPKIISCVGSDGVERRQLVKGKDDLRQDAVMEQVFGMVNQLLAKNAETRKRKLKIRNYKVIPLSQRSGMLEWCEGTTPLGDYLIGRFGRSIGAHQRHYPHDWQPIECRRKMMVDQYRKTKAELYKEITDNFHPVFRHFFLERFTDPAVWFERRLAYVKSCATCSIVGYIMGLGDRHVQNILVDCNTAELIHIDLGVAFEQGKILRTPETVPFRLTRDLVDGMGVTGVEGVYRRCCEKTMDVMRGSQEALITILEVLLYDPLYSWSLSPEKKMALQAMNEPDTSDVITTGIPTGNFLETTTDGCSSEAGNKMAERALLRLRQKLNGVEENVQLSVCGQAVQRPCLVLKLTVLRGENITVGLSDFFDVPDPYVKITLPASPDGTRKTKTISNNPNPVWNETFEFYMHPLVNNVMYVTLADKDLVFHDVIETITIKLNGFDLDEDQHLQLTFAGKSRVHLEVFITECKEITKGVRYSMDLCDEEKTFREKRRQAVLKAMESGLKRRAPKTLDEVPTIAIIGSGGGFRAMIGLSGTTCALKDIGVLDCATYFAGLSGSSWYLSTLYSHPNWPNIHPLEVNDEIRDRVDNNWIRMLFKPSWLRKRLRHIREKKKRGQPVSFTDLFGFLVGDILLDREGADPVLSDQKRTIQDASVPMPMYSCVHVKKDVSATTFSEWVDITPYEIGMQKYGIYIEPERFWDKYFCGVRIKRCPEPPLHFIKGFCGSAFSILLNRVVHGLDDPEKVPKEAAKEERDDGRKEMEELQRSSYLDHVEDEASDDEEDDETAAGSDDKVEDDSTWDKIINFFVNNISFLRTREGRAAKIHNFLRGLELVFNPKDFDEAEIKVKQLTTHPSTKKIFVCDAGLAFNSPYPIVLRQQRNVDLILSFDYSRRENDLCPPFDELIMAETWAKKNKVPFPPINYEEQYKEYGLREYYVFKDQNDPTCPIVIHFPLVNNKFKDFKAPDVRRKTPEEIAEGKMPIFDDPEDAYSTFNFHYPNKPYDRLVNLCNFNVKVCEKVIYDVIAECVERKKESNR